MTKPCAAKIGPNECNKPRKEGTLFCPRHQHASNRIYIPITYYSPDFLAQKL